MSAATGSGGPVSTDEVIFAREGRLGRITLNRPRAINALTLTMVRAIDTQLTRWEGDDAVGTILIDGAGDRGLCAGGDISALYKAMAAHLAEGGGPSGLVEFPATFWREEYRLNARLARFPKPIVAVMDGLVMGGGVGISAHSSVRLATERSAIGTPEVGIGFAPDVGATYLLSRSTGEVGTHIALSTARMSADDALLCGVVDHFVPTDLLPGFIQTLAEKDVADALGAYDEPTPPAGALRTGREWIDAAYSGDSVEEILTRLRAREEPEAAEAARAIETKSPTAVKVALRSLRTARGLDSLESCLDQEYRVSCRFAAGAEFVEGIRAAVIDKDRDPRWSPAAFEEVSSELVDTFFVSLGDAELNLATQAFVRNEEGVS